MDIPKNVKDIIKKLESKKFQAFLVGGCVRDLLIKVEPKDWDIATLANPEQIQKIFPKGFCNNEFGTVNVEGVEITPFRIEEKYTDKRHPDKVKWAKTIQEDLARRDFTINAMALQLSPKEIIDPYNGREDIEKKIIKAVGKAKDRFSEDALRMMRAVRFAAQLDFKIDPATEKAVKDNAALLRVVSKERIRDEFLKIIMSDKASFGIEKLKELGLLPYIVPELEENYGVSQNKHHIYDCYKHAVLSLEYAAKKKFNLHVRLASLLHDIGKPKTKRGQGENATFYNHEVVGAKITARILERLRLSKKDIEKVSNLVRYHLFYYNVGEVSESSVRRLLRKVGPENIDELLQLRMADRIGSGCPKAEPYKLRHLRYVIEKVSKDPISVTMLKVSGDDIMKILKEKPGPKIGKILDILLESVLADPAKNKKSLLKKEIEKLGKLEEDELKERALRAKKERDSVIMKQDKMTKDKYWVT
jgi:tRNA nucleotidyltransferase (CCA-adding enzyme)